ncbi:MAG: hypothetical protein IKQ61_13630 [Spirochaetales bacterium]|nr:hypothetical protein [Spirochaetales bacterium]
MKKILSVLIIVSVSVLSFASDFSDLLDKAKDSYAKGNLNETINLIDSARKILDKESLSKLAEEYIEVAKWDIVKLKKDYYIGKKVKITTKFCGVNSDGTSIHLLDVSIYCKFDSNLIEKILSLKEFLFYTFYGTVEDDRWNGPKLFIEKIE